MAFKVNDKGLAHLKGIEALRLRTYDDAQPNVKITSPSQVKGVLTIGYGSTKGATIGKVITESQAEAKLKAEIQEFEDAVNKYVTAPITVNMFNAMVSFCYNIGVGGFKSSKVLALTNQKKYEEASKAFFGWLKPESLYSRREKEMKLYLQDYTVLKYEYTKKKTDTSLFFQVLKLGFFFSI